MSKILITGGTGYIGSHMAVELIENGYDVIVLDNLSNSKIEALDGIEKITGKRPVFYNIDLCDSVALESMFQNEKNINAVLHFAAAKAVGESKRDPLKYYRNNLVSLINLLEKMQSNNINNLLFTSSCCVYGQPKEQPIKEDFPVVQSESPYGNTKKIGEDIVRDFANSEKDFNVIILRYFNVIGAHQSGLIGEYPIGAPENLVPYLTQSVSGKRSALQVFGNDYNTPDGTGIRDYIHVVDLVRAHNKALAVLLGKKNNDKCNVYNLGTGRGTSVMEIIKTFEEVNGVKVEYEMVARRPGDIEIAYADCEKAKTELGWQSEFDIADALRDAWRWEKSLK